VLVGGLLANALRAFKAAKEVDFMPKGFAFSYGPTVPEFVKEFGKDAEGVIAASEWLPSFPFKDPVFGSAQGFADTIQQKYGHAADYVQAAAAAGVVAQQTAVETLGLAPPLGDKEREAVMEQLHRQDIQTLYGRVKFEGTGQIAMGQVLVQIQDGKLVPIYVGGKMLAKPVYPTPKWSARK
jgi:branched-chain amino acid transport system substrate-binding protein